VEIKIPDKVEGGSVLIHGIDEHATCACAHGDDARDDEDLDDKCIDPDPAGVVNDGCQEERSVDGEGPPREVFEVADGRDDDEGGDAFGCC